LTIVTFVISPEKNLGVVIGRRSAGLLHPYKRKCLIWFAQREIVVVFITTYRYYHRISYKNCETLVREKLVFNVSPGWVVVFENRFYNNVINNVSNFEYTETRN
jgi:hypothetical protein